eukprot:5329641-Lingulodinium_polyedra.AAC.1
MALARASVVNTVDCATHWGCLCRYGTRGLYIPPRCKIAVGIITLAFAQLGLGKVYTGWLRNLLHCVPVRL